MAHRDRWSVTLVCAVAVACWCGTLAAQTTRPATTQPRDIATIRSERLELLERKLQTTEERFRQGRAPATDLFAVQKRLLHAKIEMAERPADELQLRRQLVSLLSQVEDLMHSRLQQGHGSWDAWANARDERLKEEYELARRAGPQSQD